jgi:hypothetical protein
MTNVYETARLLKGEEILDAEVCVDEGGDFGLILKTKSGKTYSTVEDGSVKLISESEYKEQKEVDKNFY